MKLYFLKSTLKISAISSLSYKTASGKEHEKIKRIVYKPGFVDYSGRSSF